jgi:hypothetical protein
MEAVKSVVFKLVEDGKESILASNQLITIPGTGDYITDEGPGGITYLVESVYHHDVFNSPGQHSVVVNLIRVYK